MYNFWKSYIILTIFLCLFNIFEVQWASQKFKKSQRIPQKFPRFWNHPISHMEDKTFSGSFHYFFFELFKICLYKLLESPELNIMLFCQFASQSSSKQYFELKSVNLNQNESWIICFFLHQSLMTIISKSFLCVEYLFFNINQN